MGKMLGGEEEKDPDAQKKEEERQEALRQQEEERKAKYAKMEAERENIRQGIRDKVTEEINAANTQTNLLVFNSLVNPLEMKTTMMGRHSDCLINSTSRYLENTHFTTLLSVVCAE